MVTLILECDNIRWRGGAIFYLVLYIPEGRGFDSRWFPWNFPSYRTMALGSTQPLTEMNTCNISLEEEGGEGKDGRCVGVTNLIFDMIIVLKSGILKILEPSEL
jgi:hypothetical protein